MTQEKALAVLPRLPLIVALTGLSTTAFAACPLPNEAGYKAYPSGYECGTVRYDVGYSSLQDRLGTATPRGTGISIGVIEPLFDGELNKDKKAWLPSPGLSDLSHVQKNDKSAINFGFFNMGSDFDSGHAAQVSRFLFGKEESLATGISTANYYNLNNFITSHLVPNTSKSDTKVFANRVNNFSAISSSFGSDTAALLRRYDWATAHEDVINVISAGNAFNSPKIFSSSFNGIYVGVTHPISGRISAPIDNVYNRFRQRPDIVTPSINTSRGAAVATSITAVLMESAANPAYSKSSPTGALLSTQNAEKSEVIKAILMAGADRATQNTRKNSFLRNPDRTFVRDENGKKIPLTSDIVNYRDDGFKTDNGLDSRYGAGQANVSNSHEILVFGEQDSKEDGGNETVSLLGFDYDEAFGNSTANEENPNSLASYLLPKMDTDAEFSITLAWNLDVHGADGLFINVLLYDLDLWLYKVTNGAEELVNSSTSSNANTETIWQTLDADEQYEFRVTTEKSVTALLWDYGIAWRTEPLSEAQQANTEAFRNELDSGESITTTIPTSNITAQAVPIPGTIWLLLSALLLVVPIKKTTYTPKKNLPMRR